MQIRFESVLQYDSLLPKTVKILLTNGADLVKIGVKLSPRFLLQRDGVPRKYQKESLRFESYKTRGEGVARNYSLPLAVQHDLI